MATVPYNPVSTAEPIPSGRDQVRLDVQPSMFGANVGAALKGLGASEEQVGGELFQRAIALKDLDNEAKAREAQTNYAVQTADIQSKFDALEGKAKVDALPQHLKALQDLRSTIRGNLGTMNAQRMYDSDTAPFMQRLIFNSAAQAGDANKKYILGTAEGTKAVAGKTYSDAFDDNEFNDKVRQVDQADGTINSVLRDGKDDARRLQSHSTLWADRITTAALKDPQRALDMLDANRQSMTDDDAKRTEIMVRAQNRASGATKLANEIYSPNKTIEQMDAEVERLAPPRAHGDDLYAKDVRTALRSRVSTDDYIRRQQNNEITQKIYEGIVALPPGSGMNELRAQPGMAQQLDNLTQTNPKLAAQIPSMIARSLQARDRQGQEQEFTRLTGLAVNDREGFLDENIVGNPNLSEQAKRTLLNKRASLINKPDDDPMYNRALGWLRAGRASEMRAAGVYFRPTQGQDATDYDHFTGGLLEAIDEWRQEKGRAPDQKEVVDTIGPALLRMRQAPGMFGIYAPYTPFGSNRPGFDYDMSVVKQWAQDNPKMLDELKNRGEPEPTDEELYRAFLRRQFIDIYSKEKSNVGPTISSSK